MWRPGRTYGGGTYLQQCYEDLPGVLVKYEMSWNSVLVELEESLFFWSRARSSITQGLDLKEEQM